MKKKMKWKRGRKQAVGRRVYVHNLGKDFGFVFCTENKRFVQIISGKLEILLVIFYFRIIVQYLSITSY